MAKKEFFQAITVQQGSEEVLVPVNRDQNNLANQLVAAQIRHQIQKQLKKYEDGDTMLTPRELRDLTEAAAKLADFSGVVYNQETGSGGQPKPVAPTADAETVDFSKLDVKK